MNTDKEKTKKDFIWRLRIDWGKSLPDLIDEWTHYQIKGDSKELVIIDASKTSEILNIIEDNYTKYSLILIHRAKLDLKGQYQIETNNNFHICEYDTQKVKLDLLNDFHDKNTLIESKKGKVYQLIKRVSLLIGIGLITINLIWKPQLNNHFEGYEFWSKTLKYSFLAIYLLFTFLHKRIKPNTM